MKLEDDIDDYEGLMDVLIRDIRKYEGKDLDPKQRNFLKHMQRRYCRYQVIHHRLTGSYYLLKR